MNKETYIELVKHLEQKKDITACYALVMLDYEGVAHTLSNASPMQITWMQKTLDMLIDNIMKKQIEFKAAAQSPKIEIVKGGDEPA